MAAECWVSSEMDQFSSFLDKEGEPPLPGQVPLMQSFYCLLYFFLSEGLFFSLSFCFCFPLGCSCMGHHKP